MGIGSDDSRMDRDGHPLDLLESLNKTQRHVHAQALDPITTSEA
jgi:hypothetical protein